MDNESLSLSHFGHLFEVFTGFYLLLGTNAQFHDYLTISQIFKSWPDESKDIQETTIRAKSAKEEWAKENRKKGPSTFEDLKQYQDRLRKSHKDVERIQQQTNKLASIGDRLEKSINRHFNINNPKSKEPTEFYKFIRPYYIFFGVLSLSMLIMEGMYDHWKKLDNLATINFFGGFIYVAFLIQICRRKFGMVNPIRVFMGSIFFFILLLAIPQHYLPCVLNYCIISSRFIADFQVMFVVLLVLLPILTHIITLAILVGQHKKVKKIKENIKSFVRQPTAPKNIGQPFPDITESFGDIPLDKDGEPIGPAH
jgi:hypothetical protein